MLSGLHCDAVEASSVAILRFTSARGFPSCSVLRGGLGNCVSYHVLLNRARALSRSKVLQQYYLPIKAEAQRAPLDTLIGMLECVS